MIIFFINIMTANHSALFLASKSNRRYDKEGRVINTLRWRQYLFEEIQIELLWIRYFLKVFAEELIGRQTLSLYLFVILDAACLGIVDTCCLGYIPLDWNTRKGLWEGMQTYMILPGDWHGRWARAVVLKVRFPDKQHQYHWGWCLLEMWILGPQFIPTKSESLGMGRAVCFHKPFRWSWYMWKFENQTGLGFCLSRVVTTKLST